MINCILFYINRYHAHGYSSDILQYNISSDTIEKVSSLSSNTHGGVALKGKDKNLFTTLEDQ
jgi:hypothetical protein